MTDPSPRERLVAAAIAELTERGLSDRSLRAIAADLGTSHRMLIYHFGSRDGLIAAVVGAVEAQQREALVELQADPELSVSELGRLMWTRFSDPALGPAERLFFELYGQALQGRPFAAEMLDWVLEPWIEVSAALYRRDGVPPARARALARVGIATTRGLLLDLLTTGDRRGTTRAMEEFIALYERDRVGEAVTR